jgi:hypothetical protein
MLGFAYGNFLFSFRQCLLFDFVWCALHVSIVANVKSNIQEIFIRLFDDISGHGRPQGRARGALAPPPGQPRPAKNSMFLDFFGKYSIFFVAF